MKCEAQRQEWRICLPRASINKATTRFISDDTIYMVFKTVCYDETEDDPWHYLPSVQQGRLTDEMKPKRINMRKHASEAFENHPELQLCSDLNPQNLRFFPRGG